MTVFLSTLNQMAYLLLLILIGYVLVKKKIVPSGGSSLLSKMESSVFIPALVLGTFMSNFTIERFEAAGRYLLAGLVLILIAMPIAGICAGFCTKDAYVKKIYTYGLAFSNFGFMGNAVVAALFPDVFMEYLIFVLPLWMFIYVWGVPVLLIPDSGPAGSFVKNLKNLLNPMSVSMLIGMLIGVSGIPVPSFIDSAVGSLGDCMSPVAMLLTGMTIAGIDLKTTIRNRSIYLVSFFRLILLPAVSVAVLMFVPVPFGIKLCAVCAMAMPLGLNTIVVPSAYGLDTSVAAGMALISHVLSCVTIPVIFMIFEYMI